MITLLLSYLLLACSFSIASYFFIHIPALKYAGLKNNFAYSISYLLTSFIYFPKASYCWFMNTTLFKEGLYSGNVPK